MTRDEAIKEINNLVIDLFEIDSAKLKPDADLKKDLGMDSLDSVDLIVSIEKKFGIRILEAQAKEIQTLQEIYDYIADHSTN